MVILRWGSGVISAHSKVIRLITLSSTESEHVVNEGCTLALHADYMATEMGIQNHRKIAIYQDNTATYGSPLMKAILSSIDIEN